jgi:hypothetical protein
MEMSIERHRRLTVLLIVYAVASLLHFVHNAAFFAEYPKETTAVMSHPVQT